MKEIDEEQKQKIANFEDLESDDQLATLESVAQEIYNREYEKNISNGKSKNLEINDIAYSRTKNGEIVFDIEIQDGDDIHHEYYSKDFEKIMEHINALNMNAVNKNRTDLDTEEKQNEFVNDLDNYENRIDHDKEVEKNLERTEKVAKELGIDADKLKAVEADNSAINKSDEMTEKLIDEKGKISLNDEQIKKIYGDTYSKINANDKLTIRTTAKDNIGGDYQSYMIVKNNIGAYQLIGRKADGSIEKINNVLQTNPHNSSVVGADGKFITTRVETSFIIKGGNNDVAIGVSTMSNGGSKMIYERASNTEYPIGCEVSPAVDYSTEKSKKIKTYFDPILTQKEDIERAAEQTSNNLKEEESLTNNNEDNKFKDYPNETIETKHTSTSNEMTELQELSDKYGVPLDKVIEDDKNLQEAGYIDSSKRAEILANTYEVEEKNNEKTDEDKNDEEQKDKKEEHDYGDHGDGSPEDEYERTIGPKNGKANFDEE